MKIIAVIENSITIGGGFNQALNSIIQMQRICEGKFEFEVFTADADNEGYLNYLNISSVSFTFSWVDKALAKLSINPWWQSLQNRIKIVGAFEKKLLSHNCDLVYFVTPSGYSASLQRLNFIATVWDTCHRDMPEFPEVRDFNQFFLRDRSNQNYLSPAVIVLVDSASSADSISFRYGVDRARLLPMPFSFSPFLDLELSKSKDEVLAKHNLCEGYLFYPAQFWAHKNHIRILEAILLLNKGGMQHQHTVVFSGGDKGNKEYIENFVEQNNIGNQVRFLGFVPEDEIRGLYEGCQAVIMPTYFGPTNVPPFEAWILGKPLIYSMQFSGQVKNSAVLVDPDDALQLSSAITNCMDEKFCEKLVKAGKLRLVELSDERKEAESELLSRLFKFEKRLRCWSQR